jgi:ubiquitin carboxyl-terminal hydrolase 22/27/51
MCFYVKRHLDYKAYVKPSYILTRETEAAKEKEKEMEKEKEKELEKEKEAAARMKELEDDLLATL